MNFVQSDGLKYGEKLGSFFYGISDWTLDVNLLNKTFTRAYIFRGIFLELSRGIYFKILNSYFKILNSYFKLGRFLNPQYILKHF